MVGNGTKIKSSRLIVEVYFQIFNVKGRIGKWLKVGDLEEYLNLFFVKIN